MANDYNGYNGLMIMLVGGRSLVVCCTLIGGRSLEGRLLMTGGHSLKV